MTLRRSAQALSVLVGMLGIWGFWIEPASLRNEDYSLALPRWPEACGGTRVAVLADLHVGSPWNGVDKLDDVVALTEKARPDLILLTGDFVISDVLGGRFVTPEEIGARLERLSAPMGVLAVLGNHDWWLDAGRVRRALESHHIRVLEDTAVEVSAGACRLWVAGVGDYLESPHDIRRALAVVPAEAPVVVFTHNPDLFPEVPDRVNLTIASHTHGGQVYIPLLGRPIVPSKYGERFAIGPIVEEGRHLFVSPGLGTSIIPVRFLVPPEISVLILTTESMP
ncbi:MAG TPA: metallophosphoesterase [Candidatus Polarisedimenticolia bacterium]|nr:metallophosphoesterase [Candidatus Polarisedimenticolia bacterium]